MRRPRRQRETPGWSRRPLPSAAQGSAAQAAARSSAAPAAAQEPRSVPMQVGQAADSDVAMTEGAATRTETVEKIREAKRLRFHERLRMTASWPTMNSTNDTLGAMAGQACFAGLQR